MDLKVKVKDNRRVQAYYNRGYFGGITLQLYGENMIGHPIATLGYDDANNQMVLYVRNLKTENVKLIMDEEE